MKIELDLPLHEMPDGSVVDLRKIWAVSQMTTCGEKSRFHVYFKESHSDYYSGEVKWLILQRQELIRKWGKIL